MTARSKPRPRARHPLHFQPHFVLSSQERAGEAGAARKAYLDRVIPAALEPIRQRELPQGQLLNERGHRRGGVAHRGWPHAARRVGRGDVGGRRPGARFLLAVCGRTDQRIPLGRPRGRLQGGRPARRPAASLPARRCSSISGARRRSGPERAGNPIRRRPRRRRRCTARAKALPTSGFTGKIRDSIGMAVGCDAAGRKPAAARLTYGPEVSSLQPEGPAAMAHKKGQGSSQNGRDSNAQRRGVKRFGGEKVTAGNIIVRQVGTEVPRRQECGPGPDYTLFALVDGAGEVRPRRSPREHSSDAVGELTTAASPLHCHDHMPGMRR